MNVFYQWLYDHYAAPLFDDETFSLDYCLQKKEWFAYVQTLPKHERLLSLDLLNNMKACWGAQAFAYGLQAGLLLALEIPPDGIISPAAR
ncbi:hypothetical protein AALB19_09610 [Oscillospiraceae bacterium 50-58]